ncbi:gamma-glutamyltransferase [Vulgatibacter incomptus]|uniref:Glutathione hydrolase proenzyme n=1 Tax=Vulgatibacter incomptus TaxID=1391653 RepID=A0A0K1PGA9_9BACT|nr:gamma-glutamyltransferase [Vulgatibacter incomptus]AKU92144.1 Gamma-glutamyltranspeptidase [Vulgatibacter incomptus]
MRSLLLLFVLLVASPCLALPAAGEAGLVATAHPAASAAGVEMLRKGGNAVDAAVASAFALAVAEPNSSGLGGGGFALVRVGSELRFFDFREVAPARAKRDMFLRGGKPDPALSRDGPLAVAVPGAVAGYLALQERYGKLDRATVLAPAIRIAEEGFRVDERYRTYAGYRLDVLRRDPEASRIFLVRDPSGGPAQVPPLGTLLVQRDLAATLREIAKNGANAFYSGAVAKKLVADLRSRGGILEAADLAGFRVKEREPLVGSYMGHAVATAPPPSAGGAVLLTVLNVLETLPAQTPWRDPVSLHLFIETMKRAFADRALFGDPAFIDVPVAALVSKERAARLVSSIGFPSTPATSIPPGEGAELGLGPEDARAVGGGTDTTHLCTIDAAGDAVSLTTTVNYGFGAGIVAKGTGVLWNDEMDDFSIAPGVPNAFGVSGSAANAVAPGKIPLSSMTPTLVFDGPTTDSPVRVVVGSPGGPRIPTAVAWALYALLAYGADVEKALGLGRIHHQHLPDVTLYEPFALDSATLGLLLLRGHRLEEAGTWSNATMIAVDPKTGVRTGAADPRGSGTAIAQ